MQGRGQSTREKPGPSAGTGSSWCQKNSPQCPAKCRVTGLGGKQILAEKGQQLSSCHHFLLQGCADVGVWGIHQLRGRGGPAGWRCKQALAVAKVDIIAMVHSNEVCLTNFRASDSGLRMTVMVLTACKNWPGPEIAEAVWSPQAIGAAESPTHAWWAAPPLQLYRVAKVLHFLHSKLTLVHVQHQSKLHQSLKTRSRYRKRSSLVVLQTMTSSR